MVLRCLIDGARSRLAYFLLDAESLVVLAMHWSDTRLILD